MKKLLLLLPLMLMTGCNDKKSTGWVTVDKKETLVVCYNDKYANYVGSNYSILQYNSVYEKGYTDLTVKFTDSFGENTYTNHYYGTNITYAVF